MMTKTFHPHNIPVHFIITQWLRPRLHSQCFQHPAGRFTQWFCIIRQIHLPDQREINTTGCFRDSKTGSMKTVVRLTTDFNISISQNRFPETFGNIIHIRLPVMISYHPQSSKRVCQVKTYLLLVLKRNG